jgi:hypothetical protein
MSATVSYCDNGYIAELGSVVIVPDDPVPGDKYQTMVSFWWPDLQPSVSEGSQELRITLSGFPVANTKSPLCDNVPCPIVNGWNNHTWEGDVPKGVHGDVHIYENWLTADGKSIFCFNVVYYI